MEITGLISATLPAIRLFIAPIEGNTPRRQRESAAVASLLAEAFPEGPQLRIGHLPSGAPVLLLAAENIAGTIVLPSISVSHSLDFAVVALAPAGHSIGVDIESLSRGNQLQRVAPRFLSQQQLGALPSSGGERIRALTRAWTAKEALYKAFGIPGLELRSIPLAHPAFTMLTIPFSPPDSMITLAYAPAPLYSGSSPV